MGAGWRATIRGMKLNRIRVAVVVSLSVAAGGGVMKAQNQGAPGGVQVAVPQGSAQDRAAAATQQQRSESGRAWAARSSRRRAGLLVGRGAQHPPARLGGHRRARVGPPVDVAAAAPLQAETSKANPIIIEKILKRFMIVRVTPLSKVNVMKWTVSDIGYLMFQFLTHPLVLFLGNLAGRVAAPQHEDG